MTQVSFNQEDGKQFLVSLTKFDDEFRSEYKQLITAWTNLEESWKDKQLHKFESFFEGIITLDKQIEIGIESHKKTFEDTLKNFTEKKSLKLMKDLVHYSGKTAYAGVSAYRDGASLGTTVGLVAAGFAIYRQTVQNISEIRKNE